MAAPAYSTEFIATSLTTPSAAIFTIPIGFVAVIRQINAAVHQVNPVKGQVRVFSEGVLVWHQEVCGPLDCLFSWEGRIVSLPSRAPIPQTITADVQGAGAEAQIYVGGYILSG